MSHILKLAYLSVAALLLMTFVFSRAAPKDPPKADDSIYAKLNKRINFGGFDDPKLILSEILDKLTSQFDVPFEINERAFTSGKDMVKEVDKVSIVEASPLPPMKNVRLETVLHKILARIPTVTGATYTIRRDHVEITTNGAQQDEFWPKMPEDMEPIFPLGNANFDKEPLAKALKELADRSEITIILDPKAGDKEKDVATAHFNNTPLDTAVQLLAEMNDLRSVAIGKTLFVTTVEKAKRLEKKMNPPQIGINPGGNPGGVGLLGALGPVGAFGQLGVTGVGIGAFGQMGMIGGAPINPLNGTPIPPGNFRPRSYLRGGAGQGM